MAIFIILQVAQQLTQLDLEYPTAESTLSTPLSFRPIVLPQLLLIIIQNNTAKLKLKELEDTYIHVSMNYSSSGDGGSYIYVNTFSSSFASFFTDK